MIKALIFDLNGVVIQAPKFSRYGKNSKNYIEIYRKRE